MYLFSLWSSDSLGRKLSVFLFPDYLGRKNFMIAVNIPFACGWFLLYQAAQIWHIMFGFALLGLATGLAKTTVMTYGISSPFLSVINLFRSFFFQNFSNYFCMEKDLRHFQSELIFLNINAKILSSIDLRWANVLIRISI